MSKVLPTSRWPELRMVPGGRAEAKPVPQPERPARAVGSAPVLMGLLLCDSGGVALGVVRQVVDWDGRTLRLSISPDPEAGLGSAPVIVDVPVRSAMAHAAD